MKKDILRVVVLFLLFVIALVVAINLYDIAFADEYYVICTPGAEVNVREKPKLKSAIVGCVFFADKIESDGKEKNGFVHVVNLKAEVYDGWIYKGLLVEDEPTATTGTCMVYNCRRVACRKYANGKVLRYLEDGSVVNVFAISEEWCVTNYGYIKTEFLTLNAKVRQ